MTDPKKRLLISYENLPLEVKKIFREKYPLGIDDDDEDILKVDTPKGETFKAVRLETDDAVYLIKLKTIEKSFIIDEDDEDDDDSSITPPEIPPVAEIELEEEDDDDELD